MQFSKEEKKVHQSFNSLSKISVTLKFSLNDEKKLSLPIDILLLTVDKYGFLCCFHYLREVFRSFKLALGHVYFGEMGESDSETLQVALIQCCEGGGQPAMRALHFQKQLKCGDPKPCFL